MSSQLPPFPVPSGSSQTIPSAKHAQAFQPKCKAQPKLSSLRRKTFGLAMGSFLSGVLIGILLGTGYGCRASMGFRHWVVGRSLCFSSYYPGSSVTIESLGRISNLINLDLQEIQCSRCSLQKTDISIVQLRILFGLSWARCLHHATWPTCHLPGLVWGGGTVAVVRHALRKMIIYVCTECWIIYCNNVCMY